MRKFNFTINGNKYEVEVKDLDHSIAKLEVNGTKYAVEIESEVIVDKTPKLVRPPVKNKAGEGKIKKSKTGGGSKILAPLPGIILKIKIAIGDSVSKGDELLVMEAMKMENNVLAERDGQIKSIKVAEGDNVLQGDVLIEVE